jgi:DNA-binding MarR family transcriptional regulator
VNESCGLENTGQNSLLRTLLGAAQRAEGRVESALAGIGLSLAKLSVLNHLVQAGEMLPLGQLAGRLSCVKSNMTQLVDRLETDGLVVRVADPADRRSVRAAITDEGRRRHADGTRILEEQEIQLVEAFSTGEREQFVGFLHRLSGDY